MKILRSILPDQRLGDDINQMQMNYMALRESIFNFETKEDNAIWSYVKGFMSNHGHLPDHATITQHFETQNEFECSDRVRALASITPIYKGNFLSEIENLVEEARIIKLSNTITDVKTIIKSGLEVKEKGNHKTILKGARDAGRFLSNKLVEVMTPTFGSKLGGEVLTDVEDLAEEYQKAEEAGREVIPTTGIKIIDDAIGGFRKKELYILAGFTGHAKSKTALNWAYSQATWDKTNTLYFSLEMHYPQVRRSIYCIHSCHSKFKNIRLALGLQKPNVELYEGIDPSKVRGGKLTAEEKDFFFNYVVPDLKKCRENGEYGAIHIEGDNPDSFDFTVEDLRAKAELLSQKEKIDLIVVDHALLLASRTKYGSTTERLNEVIRDLKRMAMNFNRGQGIPVLCLFQISRDGYNDALKKNGEYQLTHLSYANEAERSADIVIANWFGNDVREQKQIKYQCLKSRDQAGFPTFNANILFPAGKITNSDNLSLLPLTGNAKADPLTDVI
jgi:replicative DNA helicase